MKSNLSDLNNYLFESLDRLYDDEEDLDKEIKRAKTVATIGKVIVDNASLALNAQKYADELGLTSKDMPVLFQLENKSDRK